MPGTEKEIIDPANPANPANPQPVADPNKPPVVGPKKPAQARLQSKVKTACPLKEPAADRQKAIRDTTKKSQIEHLMLINIRKQAKK